jgi:hypothetical protein
VKTHRAVFFVILPLAAGSLGCGRAPDAEATHPDMDVYEAVVRHELGNVTAGPDGASVVVYLSLAHADPPASFLRRFADLPIRIEPGSRYRGGDDEASAVLVSVREGVERTGEDQARVMVLSRRASEPLDCGTPYPVRVKRDGDKWVADVR